MIDQVMGYLQNRTSGDLARDLLDVFIVYYIFYRALLVLRGTRAMQVGFGLALVFFLYPVAQTLQLITVSSIIGELIGSAILIIVVVFQNDIRRALMRMGSRAFLGSGRTRESKAIEEVVEAATELARHRTGAIIAFEQDANLDEFVGAHKGHVIDATVSRELLVSLFLPESMNKLHDGAVIIRDLRVAKAGVFFPMPEVRPADDSFGSRHRAALGITEETDAVVVVVSEERGSISFCFNGNIVSNLDGPGLRKALEGIFSPKRRKKRKKPPSRLKTLAEITPAPPAVRTSPAAATPHGPSLEEEAPASAPTRIRTTEPDLRPSAPEAPPPLRKAKGDRSGKAEKAEKAEETSQEPPPPSPGGGRIPRSAPLVAPKRAAATPRPEGARRPSRPDPTETGKRAPPQREEEASLPDTDERGDPS